MKYTNVFGFFLVITLELLHIKQINTEALQLTKENYQDTLDKNKIVFINFYADWCMFSAQLAPIFHQAADIIHEEYPDVKFARVDCEKEQQIALDNSISKYPTLKVFRSGQVARKEYRGGRSVDSFSAFIKNQMKASLTDVVKVEDIKIDEKRNTLIGYFDSKNSPGYQTLSKVADELRETTDFIAVLGDASAKERAVGDNIVFKPKKKSGDSEASYSSDMGNHELLKQWANDKANPLVREITFENGEELTEEGLPFLILFHKSDDVSSVQRYKNGVMRELMDERSRINFLTADGQTFSHPLHHLGKNMDDLPLICIDSFRHMYLFKKFDDVDVPGKLKEFITNLHSGKLHQDFHNPPADGGEQAQGHNHGGQPQGQIQPDPTATDPPATGDDRQQGGVPDDTTESPPETIFKRLAPSENRYSLLSWRDYQGEDQRTDL